MAELIRLVGSLLLIVGGFSVAAWLVRRTREGAANPLRVESRVSVAKGSSVAIVVADGRRLLVGAGDHGVSVLTELAAAPPDELAQPALPGLEPVVAVPRLSPFGFPAPDAPGRGPWTGLVRKLQLMTLRRADGSVHGPSR